MSHSRFADFYERVLVPTLFQPWASDLLARAAASPEERLLDVGCGTGIVARVARERLGPAARISGVDVNAHLLKVAREVAPDIEWREADAAKLPFSDGAFDRVLCQEVLQFVSDRRAAARELRRVLAP